MRWFRFYNDAMRHPKVAQLSDQHFRLWVELLCVASENDGRIPGDEALKTILRRRLDHLKGALSVLLKAGLIDPLGDGYTPHGWHKRQYKSDLSTDRVREHRAKRNVSETVRETAPDTDTDTDKIETKVSCASDDAPLTVDEVVKDWNTTAAALGLSQIRKLTPMRRKRVQAQLKRFTLDEWQAVFAKISQSPFLLGQTSDWRCDFDFVLSENNFVKILEGKYDRQIGSRH